MRLIEAFAEGCGGRVASARSPRLDPGAAAFYGMRASFRHLMDQVKAEGRDYFFIDNSYFDSARERQFRVTKNALQHTGRGESDGRRFAALGVQVKPMREDGENVVIAAQSQEFMELVGDPGWLARVSEGLLKQYGAARVIVRSKQEARPLIEDLKRAALLVTWSSAAAVTALLEGVRVACAPQCCATHAVDRAKWAAVLADHQWTEPELRDGTAWRALQ